MIFAAEAQSEESARELRVDLRESKNKVKIGTYLQRMERKRIFE